MHSVYVHTKAGILKLCSASLREKQTNFGFVSSAPVNRTDLTLHLHRQLWRSLDNLKPESDHHSLIHASSVSKSTMKISTPTSEAAVIKRKRFFIYRLLATTVWLSALLFTGGELVTTLYGVKYLRQGSQAKLQHTRSEDCETRCVPDGSEALPKGIVAHTSDLETRSLWSTQSEEKSKRQMSLLAIAAGIKQKRNVNEIVKKFPANDFDLMLFHYDGIVDKWKTFEWNNRAIHVSAINQTKWWFAKRFLHPDIASSYSYIFLWDEDLGVANFSATRYLSIVQQEGLEISQPALDRRCSRIHHPVTARQKNLTFHRTYYTANSTKPAYAGFVEIMAPAFSGASWRCVWHMIQNDLVIGWGLDSRFGYCAQGDRVQKVGIVDAEYVCHKGVPTLGPSKAAHQVTNLSYVEMATYTRRWTSAVREDKCWVHAYKSNISMNIRPDQRRKYLHS